MNDDIPINKSIVIPNSELEIIASRSGGAGGQHTNKTNTRITIRWNVKETRALNKQQKKRILEKLHASLSREGNLIVHQSASRSQQQNKEAALQQLAAKIKKALYIPKKRKKTKIPKATKEARIQAKKQRSLLKKMRSKI